ncbi:hypothetical protein QL285_036800 [Trifolium repens]|nr:hypothetical protein QL285_036800 [Trifolium repens]
MIAQLILATNVLVSAVPVSTDCREQYLVFSSLQDLASNVGYCHLSGGFLHTPPLSPPLHDLAFIHHHRSAFFHNALMSDPPAKSRNQPDDEFPAVLPDELITEVLSCADVKSLMQMSHGLIIKLISLFLKERHDCTSANYAFVFSCVFVSIIVCCCFTHMSNRVIFKLWIYNPSLRYINPNYGTLSDGWRKGRQELIGVQLPQLQYSFCTRHLWPS